jgi:hypothetical protein
MASASAGCISALALIGGCASLAMLFTRVTVPEVRVNRDFVEQEGRLLETALEARSTADGPSYAPRFRLRLELGGREREVWAKYEVTDVHTLDRARGRALLSQFQVGQDYPCWYDPSNPDRVVLQRGYTWFAWLLLLLPVPFIAIGGGGLFFVIWNWGKSAERRAVSAQRAAPGDLLAGAATMSPPPTVPSYADLTDSPGTTMAFRLPSATGGWNLFGLFALAVGWNAMLALFGALSTDSLRPPTFDWLTAGILLSFGLVGLGLSVLFVRRLLVAAGVGATIVEISAHPLFPGGEYEIFVSQSGNLHVRSFNVSLVCEEEATYRQGTDARTASRRVYEQELCRHEGFAIRHGAAFEVRAPLAIPARAMHSFRAEHNSVCWKLLVRGRFVRPPEFERSFPVSVYPAPAGNDA